MGALTAWEGGAAVGSPTTPGGGVATQRDRYLDLSYLPTVLLNEGKFTKC